MTVYDEWGEPLNILQYDSKLGWTKFPEIWSPFQNQTKKVLFKTKRRKYLHLCDIATASSPPSLWPMITRSRHRISKTLSNRYRLSPLKIQRESKPDYKKKNILWHLMHTADRSGGLSKEKCSKSDLGNNSAAPQAPATPLLQPVKRQKNDEL